MKFITVIKKIGERILSIVEQPIKSAEMLTAFLSDAKKDYPATKTALVELVSKFEAMSPDVLAAVASKGFDIPDDLKSVADIQSIFVYVQGTLLPTIESDYADFEKDAATVEPVAAAPVPVPASPASATVETVTAAPAVAPGLHNVVPA